MKGNKSLISWKLQWSVLGLNSKVSVDSSLCQEWQCIMHILHLVCTVRAYLSYVCFCYLCELLQQHCTFPLGSIKSHIICLSVYLVVDLVVILCTCCIFNSPLCVWGEQYLFFFAVLGSVCVRNKCVPRTQLTLVLFCFDAFVYSLSKYSVKGQSAVSGQPVLEMGDGAGAVQNMCLSHLRASSQAKSLSYDVQMENKPYEPKQRLGADICVSPFKHPSSSSFAPSLFVSLSLSLKHIYTQSHGRLFV